MATVSAYTPYGTLEANYNRLAGVQPTTSLQAPTGYDPIQYSQPVTNLRQNRDVININPNGGMSSQDRIQTRANKLAEEQAAQSLGAFQAQGLIRQQLEPARQNFFNNYRLTPQERTNVDRLIGQGYSAGFAFNNRGTRLTANANQSTGRAFQNNYDQFNNQIEAINSGFGYNPTNSLEQSYQRLLGRF